MTLMYAKIANPNSRVRLAKYYHKYQYFKAKFGYLGLNKENQPTVILFDVYPVHPDGSKIPIRSKPKITDEHGKQIACDHLWTVFSAAFCRQGELLFGDEIMFKAKTVSYKITRQNTLNQRNQIWQNSLLETKQAYQAYLQTKNNTLSKLNSSIQLAKEKAYKAYKNKLLTYDEMKIEQDRLDKLMRKYHKQNYQRLKAKQKRRLMTTDKKIKDVKLIDYTLADISKLTIVKYNHKFDKYRLTYDSSCFNDNDLSYLKFLIAHSLAAYNNKLSSFEN